MKCPADALHWKTRRFRILEEVLQHNPDIICLQVCYSFLLYRRDIDTRFLTLSMWF